MKKQALLLLAGLLISPAFAQPSDPKDLTVTYDRLLSEQFKPDKTGAAALVARNGQIIYKKAFGMANLELEVPMKVDNVFRIGSITKQFTAVAILQLMEQGKLSLQDEITRFLPDYPTQGAKTTIEHLLTHTSGIQDYTGIKDSVKRSALDVTPGQMIDYFSKQPMRFSPGTKWEYSNSNYFLLGYIIEKTTGRTYAEYLEDHFFKPLGMTSSFYASDTRLIKNRAGAYTKGEMGLENAEYISMTQPYAAGSILSTVEDLYKWHKAVQAHKLIKKETLDKAFTRYRLTDGQETAYGYGWRLGNVYEFASIWHGGLINGFVTMEMYLPKEDVFVVVFSNCDCNSPALVTSRMAALAAGKPYKYREVPVEPPMLPGYIGVYENGKGQQRIVTASDSTVYAQEGRGPRAKVKAYGKDRFFYEDALQTIEFSRNKAGEIESLTTMTLRGNEVWTKTNKPMPSQDGIQVNENILASYAGKYEITSGFGFVVSQDHNKLFLQATRQEKLEIFAETDTKFFLKVNGAQLEFVKNESGTVIKAILNQGGRKTEATKVK